MKMIVYKTNSYWNVSFIRQGIGALLLVAIFLSGVLTSTSLFAEGSKELYPENGKGLRTYLNSRPKGTSSAAFDPYPNPSIHKVYVQPGETIYMGSSVTGKRTSATTAIGGVILRDYEGNVVASVNSLNSTTGLISNRQEELAGPARPGATSGYTPLTYSVPVDKGGIYEVEFTSLGTGTNLPDGTVYHFAANANTWTQPINTNSSALILAWDVSVGNGTTGELFPGRVYTTVFNGTGPNNRFLTPSFYGVFYVLTPEAFIYEVDNNGQNGASFNFFSNNKGVMNADNNPNAAPSYASWNNTSIADLQKRIWDPRGVDGSGNYTNKIFYNIPDTASFPATAPTYYSQVGTTGKFDTWLKGTSETPEVKNLVANCAGIIRFVSNIEGQYQIIIDANGNGSNNDPVDRVLSGSTSIGENEVIWDGKDGNGNTMASGAIAITVRITTAEVHFPFLDVEANQNGILIKRLGTLNADTVFWSDKTISHPTSGNGAFCLASNPNINNTGIRSTENGHIWGTKPENENASEQARFYGNEKTIDTWAFVFDEAKASTNYEVCLTASGNVWNDVNGNGIIDAGEDLISGYGTSVAGEVTTGENLYAYLLNSNNEVIDRVQVQRNGSYGFSYVPHSTTGLKILVSSKMVFYGTEFGGLQYPEGWINVVEGVDGSNATHQTSATDGIINLNTNAVSVLEQNFGIEGLPQSQNHTVLLDRFPDSETALVIGQSFAGTSLPNLSGTDREDGTYAYGVGTNANPQSIIITKLPTNAVLYYNDVAIVDENFLITDFSKPLTVKISGLGVQSVNFEYAYIDALGKVDPSPAAYSIGLNAPLSLNEVDFTLAKVGGGIQLNWSVTNNNLYEEYAIMRSANAITWQEIGQLTANENQSTYQFLDAYALNGKNYYRLKLIDYSKNEKYSVTRLVTLNNAKAITIHPNPASSYLSINGLSGVETISIYDMTGRLLIADKATEVMHKIDLYNLPQGIFTLTIIDHKALILTERIVKIQ